MSWLYSRALVEDYLVASYLGGEPSVRLSLTNTPEMFLWQGKTTEVLSLSRFGMTCELLTDPNGEGVLMSFLEAFPARTLAPQEVEKDLTEKGLGFGQKCGELLARFDQNTSSWKTAHCLLFEELDWYSGIFPRWGIMQGGELWEVMMLDYPPSDNASGLLPAPCATDWKETGKIERQARDWNNKGYGHQKRPAMFYAHFYKSSMPAEFEEHMMGWPAGWSDLKELETGKLQDWLNSHGIH